MLEDYAGLVSLKDKLLVLMAAGVFQIYKAAALVASMAFPMIVPDNRMAFEMRLDYMLIELVLVALWVGTRRKTLEKKNSFGIPERNKEAFLHL